MEDFTRYIAFKVPISSIKNNEYINEEQSNFININDKKVYRVNIIGVIISLESSQGFNQSLVLDDGDEKISLRAFENGSIPTDINIGEVINVIGRPREFGGEKYIFPEIIKKTTIEWMKVRKQEYKSLFSEPDKNNLKSVRNLSHDAEIVLEKLRDVGNNKKKQDILLKNQVSSIVNETSDIDIPQENVPKQDIIIDMIKKRDNGQGVEIENIIEKFGENRTEDIIEVMLKEGELFEFKPGRVKVLE